MTLLLELALALFLVGVVELLWDIHGSTAIAITAAAGLTSVTYIIIASRPLWEYVYLYTISRFLQHAYDDMGDILPKYAVTPSQRQRASPVASRARRLCQAVVDCVRFCGHYQLHLRLWSYSSVSFDDVWTSLVRNPGAPAQISTPRYRDITKEIRGFDPSPCVIGGYGDVHQAVHSNLGLVAVKRPRFTADNRASKVERLMKECCLLAELDHRNILPCVGYYIFQNTPCIVTPWASNGAMGVYLKRNPNADIHNLLSQVASALQYLHTRESPIIHGDLYINNVLIDAHGQALLCDFGLSRVFRLTDPSPTRTSVGRWLYQGPELATGDKLSTASDVFAFAMLIVETYSGRRPLARAPTDIAAYIQMSRGERPSRNEITRPDFPEELWTMATECWRDDPLQRPCMMDIVPRLTRIP